ncbi:MAG: dihydroorotase [Prolixibacteraceae bacterium]|jgi:dihydroorotase|nr:dihydroorotase [Prolixibacteraceae bacterium]
MKDIIIKDAKVVNEGKVLRDTSLLIRNGIIEKIFRDSVPAAILANSEVIDASGKYLLPGVIDDQVHFREPGLTHKGDIYSESKAAVAGGVTSFMEMPNTVPQATTHDLLNQKYQRASEVSLANYSFYIGATNDNLEELLKTDPEKVCGIKVFMGSSTGNMLVDNPATLASLFQKSKMLIAVHCEDESIVQANLALAVEKYGEEIPLSEHPKIRDASACFNSSSKAVELAKKYGTRLHILHVSTAAEIALFESAPIKSKKITSEVCVHHLWFSDADYKKYGAKIKWNPAIKSASDRAGLIKAVNENRIDVIATDHAPHTEEEKGRPYLKMPSGGPLVEHSLVAMLEMSRNGKISIEKVVEKMCHAPADLFGIEKRGYIRKGYKADLVLVDAGKWTVSKENIQAKCNWSPFEGDSFYYFVTNTFVNGKMVYENNHPGKKGTFHEDSKGERLTFNRDTQ